MAVRVYRLELRVQTTGMAVRYLNQLMYEVEFEARSRVLTGPYTTGHLASQFYRRGPFVTGTTVTGRVGNRASYAQIVHDGARVHDIYPRDRRRWLKFYWRRAGRVVYFKQIPASAATVGRSHPGQRGKHYLSEAIFSVADRRGLRVTIYDL